MKINWKVRIKNKAFWLAIIPAVALLISLILELFGVNYDFSGVVEKLLKIVEAVFLVLAILGIVNDPTTATLSDSDLAMTYQEPKKECK